MANAGSNGQLTAWRVRVVIFEADTKAGKAFDVALLILIFASVVLLMAESMAGVRPRFTWELYPAEWIVTAFFTTEYVLRLVFSPMPWRYGRSFFGVVGSSYAAD